MATKTYRLSLVELVQPSLEDECPHDQVVYSQILTDPGEVLIKGIVQTANILPGQTVTISLPANA